MLRSMPHTIKNLSYYQSSNMKHHRFHPHWNQLNCTKINKKSHITIHCLFPGKNERETGIRNKPFTDPSWKSCGVLVIGFCVFGFLKCALSKPLTFIDFGKLFKKNGQKYLFQNYQKLLLSWKFLCRKDVLSKGSTLNI